MMFIERRTWRGKMYQVLGTSKQVLTLRKAQKLTDLRPWQNTHLKFNIAPENKPSQKESNSSNHHFSGAMLNFGGVYIYTEIFLKVGCPSHHHLSVLDEYLVRWTSNFSFFWENWPAIYFLPLNVSTIFGGGIPWKATYLSQPGRGEEDWGPTSRESKNVQLR